VTRRRGRRRKKLLDDLKDRRGYCQLKEEALDRPVWKNRFGRGFGPVVWQITDDDDQLKELISLMFKHATAASLFVSGQPLKICSKTVLILIVVLIQLLPSSDSTFPWSTVSLEQLLIAQSIKKLPAFYRTRSFVPH